ncbi:hypothetical protein C8T65DRAFT_565410 [Cerioporus squamosus]|nr:hypothetical protein C8T65DRAFT_565410 [Cerioporus squamosus]
MALAALPVELLDAVLAPLAAAPPALAAAARTCSALNPAATRLLYRHLSLSAYARNLSLIHLLAARPSLARLVRTFSIHLDDAEPAVLPTYSDLQRALHLMTNLSSLALYVDASTSWILSPPEGESGQKSGDATIPGPPFHPRLEHLTCNFPLDAHLASFLGQIPALISLTLSSFVSDADLESHSGHAPPTPNHVHIPSSHLPLLEAYTGPAHLLPTLASRPLKAVLLSGDLTLDLLPSAGAPSHDRMMSHLRGKDVTADWLPSADSQLQVLSAMTSAPPADLLETLAMAFPNLVCLRLMTTRALWDSPDLQFYSRIASTLESLHCLTVFELAGIHWQSRVKPSSSEAKAKAEEKEWISPPVTPRAALPEVDDEFQADRDYDFDGAFLDWSY